MNTLNDDILELFSKILSKGLTVLAGIASAVCSTFLPAIPILVTAFCFILADTYYGYKVSKRYGKKKFESGKFWHTIIKLKDAVILICLMVLLDKYILMTYETLTAAKVAASTVILAETISLIESFRALHPNALLSKILSKVIKSKAEKYLDVDLSDVIKI